MNTKNFVWNPPSEVEILHVVCDQTSKVSSKGDVYCSFCGLKVTDERDRRLANLRVSAESQFKEEHNIR